MAHMVKRFLDGLQPRQLNVLDRDVICLEVVVLNGLNDIICLVKIDVCNSEEQC